MGWTFPYCFCGRRRKGRKDIGIAVTIIAHALHTRDAPRLVWGLRLNLGDGVKMWRWQNLGQDVTPFTD